MGDIAKIKLTEALLSSNEIITELPNRELLIDKSEIGTSESAKLQHNFLAVARNYPSAKKLLIKLANNGFFLVDHSTRTGTSVFRRILSYNDFVKYFKDDDVKVFNDTFYKIEKPILRTKENRLLVIFSSIADFPMNASISRRMFFKNFETISKYIPKNTYILRIADIGAVLGSFYLNSNFDPLFEDKVQALISKIAAEFTVPDENIVLYGVSKGGTGALYHGILSKYKTVAVDPIMSDDHYLYRCNDLHFVEGVFPVDKQTKFKELISKVNDLSNINIICSKNSEQYEFLESMILNVKNTNSYQFNGKNIKTHTDVGPETISFLTAIINALFYNIKTNGSFEVEC